MELISVFKSLNPPISEGRVFNAAKIPGNEFFRIAIDAKGMPALLLPSFVIDGQWDIPVSPLRLEHLKIDPCLTCTVCECIDVQEQSLTVLSFTGNDPSLSEYFLRISGTLVEAAGPSPTAVRMLEIVNNFIEIFRAMSDVPKRTVQGLWAELFLIEKSKNYRLLLDAWHNSPDDKFDFDAGSERIEVKSTATTGRTHYFSSGQLNPPDETRVLIASVQVRTSVQGATIMDLIEKISKRWKYDEGYGEKLYGIVSSTLGNSLNQGLELKFDYKVAEGSLLFVDSRDVPKIDSSSIPLCVTDVTFSSNLEGLESINPLSISLGRGLFESL